MWLPLLLLASAPVRIAVIPLVEGPGATSASAVLDRVAASIGWRPTLELASDAEISSPLIPCGADERCIADALRASHVELGLVIVVSTEVEPGLISIRAIDAASAKTIARASGSLAAEGAALLARLLEQTLDELGHRRAAKLHVAGDEEIRGLVVTPPPLKQLGPNRFFVEPGRVRVEAPGLVAADAEARAGEEVEIALALPPPSPSIVESPWFWVAIGGAVIAAGAATAAIVATRPSDVCVCLGRPAEQCPDC